ncbi:hypothetical protein F5Y14DRAFT_165658 [Nemania sp. NC0429]|nr:hypothetical protein F5Y14DRAFT_165658 [Nemania sp. NC0429]
MSTPRRKATALILRAKSTTIQTGRPPPPPPKQPRISFSAPILVPVPLLPPAPRGLGGTYWYKPSHHPARAYLSTSAPAKMSSPSAPGPAPSSSSDPPAAPDQTPAPTPAPTIPPLSAREFKEYNRLAEHMDLFHAHFRSTWETLYTSASSGRRAGGLSIRAFINAGLDLVRHLEMHHSIEEQYVFPLLARRMPEFRTGRERPRDIDPPRTTGETEAGEGGEGEKEKKEKENKEKKIAAELLRQHVEIHKGMDGLRDYLQKCQSGETELRMPVLKAQLDTWGAVLWTHLDQEVRTLGAENMRRYWTLDEMRRFRM